MFHFSTKYRDMAHICSRWRQYAPTAPAYRDVTQVAGFLVNILLSGANSGKNHGKLITTRQRKPVAASETMIG